MNEASFHGSRPFTSAQNGALIDQLPLDLSYIEVPDQLPLHGGKRRDRTRRMPGRHASRRAANGRVRKMVAGNRSPCHQEILSRRRKERPEWDIMIPFQKLDFEDRSLEMIIERTAIEIDHIVEADLPSQVIDRDIIITSDTPRFPTPR